MKRVLCNATIEEFPDGSLEVTVEGVGDFYGNMRVYHLDERDPDRAAREGIRKFVEEMGGDL